MDTLLLTDSSPVVELRKSDRLFFDRYQYSLRFHMRGITLLRSLIQSNSNDPTAAETALIQRYWIRKILSDRSTTAEQHRLAQDYRAGFLAGASATDRKKVFRYNKLLNFFTQNRETSKLVLGYNCAYFYTSELSHVNQLLAHDGVFFLQLLKTDIDRPRDTVVLQQSDYTNRTYFRSCLLDDQQKHQVRNFLVSQQNIRLCPSLRDWVDGNYLSLFWGNHIRRYYFVDHNEQGCILMLSMIAPHMVRKTVKIKKVNEIEVNN